MSKDVPDSDEIFWRFEVAIIPGKLDDFVSVARDLMAVMDQEPGTLSYEYRTNAEKSTCHIFERFRDSAGLVAHAEHFGADFAARFMDACKPVSFYVYGVPDEAARSVLAAYAPVYLSWKIA